MSDSSKSSSNSTNGSENLILPDEKEILLDHNYDGIEELDNPLPKWWQFIFYGAIVFSVVYVAYYEFGSGPSLQDELKTDLEKWDQVRALAQQSASADGGSLDAIASDPAQSAKYIETGKQVYATYCMACHGEKGEGNIGPNLTDPYWIHGKGQLEDIAQVMRTGVAEKGMPPWESVLKPDEFKAAAIFVGSLNGSTPPNPKAPEGEKIE